MQEKKPHRVKGVHWPMIRSSRKLAAQIQTLNLLLIPHSFFLRVLKGYSDVLRT